MRCNLEVMVKTKKNDKTQLAKNLILRRFDMNMSGEKFAEYLEIPYGTLRDIEAGISNGRASTKLKIAKKLNISVEELEGPTPGELEARRSKAPRSKSEMLGRLMELLPVLNEKQIAHILAGIEGMHDPAIDALILKLSQRKSEQA